MKVPIALRLLQSVFPIANALGPGWADKWAVRLFLTPQKLPYTEKAKAFLKELNANSITLHGKEIWVYNMGTGPVVLCVHGWAGKATQFREVAHALVEAGYTFLSFDAPAHGRSQGKTTNMVEFYELVVRLVEEHRPVAYVGHSLGAAALSFALASNLPPKPFVALGAPVQGSFILESFRQTLHGNERNKEAIRKETLKRYGRVFEELLMEHTFAKFESPVLSIHGSEDMDVPVQQQAILRAIRPQEQYLRVEGAGHRRILKDENALRTMVAFIAGQAGA